MSTEKQPFTLNHDGKSLGEIVGKSEEECHKLTDENVHGDIPFAIFLLKVLSDHQEIGAVTATILSGILDVDIDKPSELTEYVVRTVPEGPRRKDIYLALDFAAFGPKGEKSELEELLEVLGKKAIKVEGK